MSEWQDQLPESWRPHTNLDALEVGIVDIYDEGLG